ncbi:hypothetical protein S83_052012 [Arachis hypogaea]
MEPIEVLVGSSFEHCDWVSLSLSLFLKVLIKGEREERSEGGLLQTIPAEDEGWKQQQERETLIDRELEREREREPKKNKAAIAYVCVCVIERERGSKKKKEINKAESSKAS